MLLDIGLIFYPEKKREIIEGLKFSDISISINFLLSYQSSKRIYPSYWHMRQVEIIKLLYMQKSQGNESHYKVYVIFVSSSTVNVIISIIYKEL